MGVLHNKLCFRHFLKNKQYTHLCIAPDDLLFTPYDLEILKTTVIKTEYDVVSGCCPVDDIAPKRPINIIKDNLPSLDRRQRSYRFIWYEDLKEDITQVKFSGFPLMIISRNVVESIDFVSESKLIGDDDPNNMCNMDLIFCYKCQHHGIPIYVNRKAYMKHLRNQGVVDNDEGKRYIQWKSSGMLSFL